MPAPVKGIGVSTPYGKRNARLWKWKGYHTGDDYAVPIGTPVYATRAGRVIRVIRSGAYGLHTVISHGGGVTSWYAHLSRASVRVGQTVKTGTRVGSSGNTGNVTGPHLHYEERKNNQPRKPVYNRTSTPVRSKKYVPPAFPKGIGPNKSKPSAVRLQRALKKAGYMPKSVKEHPNYGPETQKAVGIFHNSKYGRKYKSRRYLRIKKRDPRIGPKGWAALFRKAYG